MKKPNILMMVQLPPPIHGASTINKSIVESKLVNEKFNLILLSLNFANKVDEIGKASFLKIWFFIKFQGNLIKTLVSKRIDLVYFTLSPTGFAFYRDIIFVMILKLFRKRIVFHLHGKGIEEKSLKSKTDKFLYSFVFKNTIVIILSESLNRDINLIYDGIPYVLNNGINPQEIFKVERKTQEPVTFVFLSNLKVSKGIKTFLEALKIMHEKGYKYKAKIIGDPVDFSIEEAQIFIDTNHMSENVEVLGPKYGEEKFKELSYSDVFVFPTENDCFPLTILEAMQMQLPIISTCNGAIPDIVEDKVNGFIVNEGDVEQVSNAMIAYIQDPNLISRHGLNNLEKYKNKYTQQLFEENFVKTIQNILSNLN